MQEIINDLKRFFSPKIEEVKSDFVRDEIAWFDHDLRLIGIKGARGVGKSTLMIQYLKSLELPDNEWLYLSMDHPYFLDNDLLDLISHFYDQGGRLLLLDEAHRYDRWSLTIKLLYDAKPHLRILFTGSSILQITKADADLSRRAIMFELAGLSFREYLRWEGVLDEDKIDLGELLEYHDDFAYEFSKAEELDILSHFKTYLRHGYYPFYKETIPFFPLRLRTTVDLLLDQDIPEFYNYSHLTIKKIKLLLQVLAQSKPFKPNITKLASRLEQHRSSVSEQLYALQRAGLLLLLPTSKLGMVQLQKPEKVFLANPNLAHHLTPKNPDKGTLREIFFYNQFSSAGLLLTAPEYGDFKHKDFIFEVGGARKARRQLKGYPKAFTAVDDVLVGSHNRIPLWLFGFLY